MNMRFIALSRISNNLQRAKRLYSVFYEISQILNFSIQETSVGNPVYSKELNEDIILKYLVYVQEKRSEGIPEIICISNENKKFNLFFDTNISGVTTYDYIWFSLNAVNDTLSSITSNDLLITLFKSVYNSFQSEYAFTEEEALMELFYAKESYRIATKNLPNDLIRYLPVPDFTAINKYNIPSLKTRQEISEFDFPNGIWWINCLNGKQIENLGRENMFSFEWYKIEPLNSSDFLFMLTNQPTDINNLSHLDKLRNIVSILNLNKI
jgi:hypothetical protein